MLSRLAILLSTTLLGTSLFAQSKPKPAPEAQAAPVKPPVVILYECKAGQCPRELHKNAVWIFEGNHGEAVWPYGAVADLTVKSFGGSKLVIERVDRKESSSQQRWADPTTQTFHATYTATLNVANR